MSSTLTNLLYHIVFSTKNREPIITKPIRTEFFKYIGGIIRGEGGVLLEIGGMPDHVHLVVRFKAEPSVATMVKVIKSKSSKWLNEQPKRPGRFEWQRGYAAFTVSVSQLRSVRAYVKNQEQHHRRRSFQEELGTVQEMNYHATRGLSPWNGH
jgi:REP element-mobilizing transposase RayT